MDDERTWEDQQDSLDYRQWKAEQDAERANMDQKEVDNGYAALVGLDQANTLDGCDSAVGSGYRYRNGDGARLLEAVNLTAEQKAVLLEAVSDYIYVYENHSKMTERVKAAKEVVAIAAGVAPTSDNVASLKTELAAALGDIIAYRRMRYADSVTEEARYRELTGHGYDDEVTL